MAESFAVAGAKLILVYNRTPPPATLEERCVRFGAAAVTFIQCNVSELESCRALVQKVSQKSTPALGVFFSSFFFFEDNSAGCQI